jgi:hypothetical protein
LPGTPGKLDPDKVKLPDDEDLAPAPVKEDLEEWVYIDRESIDDRGKALDGCALNISLRIG